MNQHSFPTVLYWTLLLASSSAFTSVRPTWRSSPSLTTTAFMSSTPRDSWRSHEESSDDTPHDEDHEDAAAAASSSFDVEAARGRLEALVGGGPSTTAPPEASTESRVTPDNNNKVSPKNRFNRFLPSFLRKLSSDDNNNNSSESSSSSLVPSSEEDAAFDVSTLDWRILQSLRRHYQSDSTRPQQHLSMDSSVQSISRPPTALELDRRQAEMTLLSRLADTPPPTNLDVPLPPASPTSSDNTDNNSGESPQQRALSDLWTLWFHEHGSAAARRLMRADELMQTHEFARAEEELLGLVHDYCLHDNCLQHWAEPLNRLATLYYMQGHHRAAEILCRMVLTIKPWHFGALSGIVMVYAALGETQQATEWAAKRLPPQGQRRRRRNWVRRALDETIRSRQERCQSGQEWWGPTDSESLQLRIPPKQNKSNLDPFNCWQ